MVQDRRVAFIFRLCAFLFATCGLMSHVGIFKGEFLPGAFMYYTIQSNLLAIILFGVLAVRTAVGLREGRKGNAGWYPRFGMVVAVNLLVTFVVFWGLLMPQGMDPAYLLSFDNIAVHTVTPLACLLDYVLFSPPRSLKYRDVYYVCIFPLFYALMTTIAGLSGYVFRYTAVSGANIAEATPMRFPYFFLDFDILGIAVFAYMGAIMIFFLVLSHALYFIDQKVRKPRV